MTMGATINIDKSGLTNIAIPKGIINLDKTFDCGQCFRWEHLVDGSWSGIVGDDLIITRIVNDGYEDNLDHIITTMPITRAGKFIDYLGLPTDYTLLENLDLSDIEKSIIKNGKGIRILRQDNWETIVSFIISQRNNIPKIKTSINRLCMKIGERRTYEHPLSHRKQDYYKFPTAEQIKEAGVSILDECGLGYRSDYVYRAACSYIKDYKIINELNAVNVTGQQVIDFFIQYKGIGPKVANCIALFGFGKLDTFPIDVWIERAINIYFNNQIDIEKYGSLAGLMQQYLFYYVKK